MSQKWRRQPAQGSLPGRARDQTIEERQRYPSDDHQHHELASHCPVSFLICLSYQMFPITVLKIHRRTDFRCDSDQIEKGNFVIRTRENGSL
jgi:hypothetical protein